MSWAHVSKAFGLLLVILLQGEFSGPVQSSPVWSCAVRCCPNAVQCGPVQSGCGAVWVRCGMVRSVVVQCGVVWFQ